MYTFLGKINQFYKFNANCKDSEKTGKGPGSCGGSKDTITELPYSDYEYEESESNIANSEKLYDTASEEEIDAIDSWSRGEYERINNAIFGKSDMTSNIESTINELDSILDRSTVEKPITLYRGVSEEDFIDMQKKFKLGNIVYKGFMSTTPDRNEANSFSESGEDKKDLLVRIEAKPGIKALRLTNTWSRHSDENEYILGRNQKFVFKGILENDEAKYIQLEFTE